MVNAAWSNLSTCSVQININSSSGKLYPFYGANLLSCWKMMVKHESQQLELPPASHLCHLGICSLLLCASPRQR